MWRLTGFTKKDKQKRSITPVGFADAFFMANSSLNVKSVDSNRWFREWEAINVIHDSVGGWDNTLEAIQNLANEGWTPEYLNSVISDRKYEEFAERFDGNNEVELVKEMIAESLERDIDFINTYPSGEDAKTQFDEARAEINALTENYKEASSEIENPNRKISKGSLRDQIGKLKDKLEKVKK